MVKGFFLPFLGEVVLSALSARLLIDDTKPTSVWTVKGGYPFSALGVGGNTLSPWSSG